MIDQIRLSQNDMAETVGDDCACARCEFGLCESEDDTLCLACQEEIRELAAKAVIGE